MTRATQQASVVGTEVAIIGMGEWAQRAILPTLINHSRFNSIRKIHLVAQRNHHQVHSDYARQERFAVYQADELERVWNNPAISAAIICTRDESHYRLTAQALQAGKQVLTEKTLVYSETESAALVELAEKNNCALMVGYQYLFDYRFQALQSLIASEGLGAVREVELFLMNAAPSRYDGNIVQTHVTHQLSILQALFGLKTLGSIVVTDVSVNHIRCLIDYDGITVNLTTMEDAEGEQNLRWLRVEGEQLRVDLDYEGASANFQLYRQPDKSSVPPGHAEFPEVLRTVSTTTPLEQELAVFFGQQGFDAELNGGGKNAHRMVQQMCQINELYESALRHSWVAGREQTEQLLRRLDKVAEKDQRRVLTSPMVAKEVSVLRKLGVFKSQVLRVGQYLARTPYATAREVMKAFDLEDGDLKLIYKTLQRSGLMKDLLKASDNFDYAGVVEQYFNRARYEMTFFVGTACPYKCTFCKQDVASVELDPINKRFLYKRREVMTAEDYDAAFAYLERLREKGKQVAVKISGGLEPLTDPAAIRHIMQRARDRGMPVAIYSNGVFLEKPEIRDLVLQADELRISLNVLNEEAFSQVYFPTGRLQKSSMTLAKLKRDLRQLMQARNAANGQTRVGLNVVVIKDIVSTLCDLALMAHELGLDYVNYNADYSETYADATYLAIGEQLHKLKRMDKAGHFKGLRLNYGGALLRHNLFNHEHLEQLDPGLIGNNKLFVDPGGHVSPIHEGTFPVGKLEGFQMINPYVIGHVGEIEKWEANIGQQGLLKPLDYAYLAPFEKILALEARREAEDEKAGFGQALSPYHYRFAGRSLADENKPSKRHEPA